MHAFIAEDLLRRTLLWHNYRPIPSCFTIIIICLRFIEVAAQFVSMQKWGPCGPQEAFTSPIHHTASPAPSTCVIIISNHIVHNYWGWLREAYLRNGEELNNISCQSAWFLPSLGSVQTPGDIMSVKITNTVVWKVFCFQNKTTVGRLVVLDYPSLLRRN